MPFVLVVLLLFPGVPLIAFLYRCAGTGGEYFRARWPVVAGYYAIFPLLLVLQDVLLIGASLAVTFLFGPILALFLGRCRPFPKPFEESRGFEVVVYRAPSGQYNSEAGRAEYSEEEP